MLTQRAVSARLAGASDRHRRITPIEDWNEVLTVKLLVIAVLVALVGCTPAQIAQNPTVPPATTVPATTAPPTEAAAADAPAAQTVARPAWQTLPLINAATGATFTLADFAGRTVFVEPMATWCTNCRQQLGNVAAARAQVSADQVVFIALSVETNISAADLSDYAADNGFDWTFAVLTPELLEQLVLAFGRTVSNPPSTPHFIIRPDGSATELATGIESSDQIVEQLRAAGAA